MKKFLKWGGIALVVLLIIGAVSGSGESSTSSSSSTTSSDASSKVSEQKIESVEDPNPNFSDGTHEVGKDIEPGTYRTRAGKSGCYYARLSGFSNEFSDILSNDNTDAPTVVTIEATDKGFKSTRCGTWTQDLSQITESKTSFGDGVYIVGTDIEPGQYKNSGQSGCYYARLSGFHGDFGDIISNENSDDVSIVNIAATDKGFKSTRCGTWVKQ